MAKAASTKHMTIGHQVLSFTQHSPATKELEIQVIPAGIDWTILITSYLKNGTLLKDHNASRRLKVQALRFVLMGEASPDHM